MKLIDCKAIADKELEQLKERVLRLNSSGIYPKLATILIGNNYPSKLYVNNKIKKCNETGVLTSHFQFNEDDSILKIINLIGELNDDNDTHGIMLQLPARLQGRSVNFLVNQINPKKDVDCLHQLNLGLLYQNYNKPYFYPCSILALQAILSSLGVSLAGKNVVIINDGILIGRPIAAYILNNGGTPTICHKETKKIVDYTRNADIIITAVGNREAFTLEKWMVDSQAIIIDFGITRLENDKIQGDVDLTFFDSSECIITKVPGLGSLVVTMLLKNTIAGAM